jgi:dienelactone hydrolase
MTQDASRPVRIPLRMPAGAPQPTVALDADLIVPAGARGLVVFAHGSGSSRHSPRHRQVAAALGDAGLATLLADLLTPEEEGVDLLSREHRFDIDLLARRVAGLVDWAASEPDTASLPVGLFGASTGAAAAIVAAAARPDRVRAVVSRGGRTDLAGVALGQVSAPTLLIVGGNDPVVLELNRDALRHLTARRPRADRSTGSSMDPGAEPGPTAASSAGAPAAAGRDAPAAPVARLDVIPGAGHLFEEPGALEAVARLAREWLLQHLAPGTAGAGGAPRLPDEVAGDGGSTREHDKVAGDDRPVVPGLDAEVEPLGEAAEARTPDALDQARSVVARAAQHDIGLSTEASEADLLDQARDVPLDEDLDA